METSNKNNKGLLVIVGVLIILVGALLCVLILNKGKDTKKENNNSNQTVSGALKVLSETTQTAVNPTEEGRYVKVLETDKPIDILKNKNYQYGVKLSNKGTFTSLCGIGFKENDFKYEIKENKDTKELEITYNYDGSENTVKLGIKNADDTLKAVYALYFGGCDSVTKLYFIADFGSYILTSNDFNEKTSKLDISNSYVMFYSVGIDTHICDLACDQSIDNYVIGETADGQTYIIDEKGETLIDDTFTFGYDLYVKDAEKGINQDTRIYGSSISNGTITLHAYHS